jgi:membrane-associated progesterone receptor component
MTLTFDLGTPVNTALFLYIIYHVSRIVFPPKSTQSTIPHEFKSSYSWMPKSHSQVVVYTIYTPTSLAPFDGKDGGRILLAIDGIVFDVSHGRHFYGPGTFSVIEKVDH